MRRVGIVLPSPPKQLRDDNKGGRRVKENATKREMVMGTRAASDNKGNGEGNKGGRQATALRAMAVAMAMVGKDEGDGGEGNEGGGQQRG
jgi:hypothetical protein